MTTKSAFRVGAALALAVALVGCGREVSPPAEAVIVAVQCEPRWGAPDCLTMVEFADRSRWRRSDQWGEVGDTVLAERVTTADGVRYWR